ncbi:hypothetical protein L1887_10027 [Cichorium endivia]|nr:hypothetical protein L1887_10027 [Cichorium endivia]
MAYSRECGSQFRIWGNGKEEESQTTPLRRVISEGKDNSATEGLRAWASVATVAGSVVGRPTTLDDDQLRGRSFGPVVRNGLMKYREAA